MVNDWWLLAHDPEGDYEGCAPLHYLVNGRRMELTVYRRSDEEQLKSICEALRRGEEPEGLRGEDATTDQAEHRRL